MSHDIIIHSHLQEDTEHLAPDTCWIYSHQLAYAKDDGIKKLNLQFDSSKSVLQGVDCSYSSPFCEKPLLSQQSNAPTFSGSILSNSQYIPYKQGWGHYFAYLQTYSSKPYYHSTEQNWWCYFQWKSNKCRMSSWMGTYGLQLSTNYGFTITFAKDVLITGVWWSAHKKDNDHGYISFIGRVAFKVNGVSFGGSYLGAHERTEGDNGDTGAKIIRLIQPAYTKEITFSYLQFKTSKMSWNYGHRIAFNFEVYGCDKFKMDAILCPSGWYSSRGVCIKAIENTEGKTYVEAKEQCEQEGGFILDPFNDMTLNDTEYVLLNLVNGTSDKFWIGVHYAQNDFKNREMWTFESGVPVYEFQFPHWTDDPGDASGKCAMAVINDDGEIKWSQESCDTANPGVLCQKRHFWEEVSGGERCYVSPSYEYEGTTVVNIAPGETDPVKFCRESCKLQLARYFLLKDGETTCHCILTDNAPKGGFVSKEQCAYDTCADDKDPAKDKCNPDDGYVRTSLYKTYSLTCPALDADFTKGKSYEFTSKKGTNDDVFYVLQVTTFPGTIMEIGMLDPKLLLDVYLATFFQKYIRILLICLSMILRVISTIRGEVNVEHLPIGGVLPQTINVIQTAINLVAQ